MPVVTIDEGELKRLLDEREQLRRQVAHLQETQSTIVEGARKERLDVICREFMVRYAQPVLDAPGPPPEEVLRYRFRRLLEEFLEAVEAVYGQHFRIDHAREELLYLIDECRVRLNLPALYRELIDLEFVTVGLLLTAGLPHLPGVREVHRANMAKLQEFGPDEKLLKPEGWAPPDMERLMREAGWAG